MERLKNKTLVAFTRHISDVIPRLHHLGETGKLPLNRKNRVLSSIRLAATRFRKIFKKMKWSALLRVLICK